MFFLVLKIGCLFKKCVGILKGNVLIIGNENLERKVVKFMEFYDFKWNEEVIVYVYWILKEMKRN